MSIAVVPLPRENINGHLRRLDWLRGHLKRGWCTLELGCGTGYMVTLPLLLDGYNIIGVDPDEWSIRYGRGLLEATGLDPTAIRRAELHDLEGPFDAVIATEILEHLDDEALAAVLGALRERLVQRGLLLVTVPNGYGWFEMEAALWSRGGFDSLLRRRRVNRLVYGLRHRIVRGYVDAHHPSTLADSPHVQRFTFESIERAITEGGFEVVDRTGSVLIAGPFSQLFFTGVRPIMRINAWLGRRFPRNAAGFYLAARRAD
jgi:SAM-dependent methyltransferase